METRVNKHGVECVVESSGHFGRFSEELKIWETNLPILVPVVCTTCENYDPGEPGDYGSKVGAPYCMINCFFPVRKGTCLRKKERINGKKNP